MQWHSRLQELPQSCHKLVLRLAETNGSNSAEIDLILKTTIARLDRSDLKRIDNLPAYLEKLFKQSSSGELYDPDEVKKQTKIKAEAESSRKGDLTLRRRAEVLSLSKREGESRLDFEKRINHEEFIKQMQRYGQKLDPVILNRYKENGEEL